MIRKRRVALLASLSLAIVAAGYAAELLPTPAGDAPATVGCAVRPELGWAGSVHVVRVVDGDTLVVEIRRRLHVRLVD
ncbi:MAG: hypothetical protein AAF961_10795, partial [Planctomycetota bacterium]